MPKHLSSLILLIILTTVFPQSPAAKTNFRFMHITGKDGLPYQQVEELLQDDKGRLWIGTRNGLSRYDGYNIVSYFNQEDNQNSLTHNTIECIFQDSKKRIWIGTHDGTCLYRPETDDFKRYEPIASSIIETHDGKIVCGGKQLYYYDEKSDNFILVQRKDSEYIISLAVDEQNRIFVATNNSIFYYDSSFTKTTQINPSYFSDFLTGFDGIIPLYFDSKGLLWIGRNGKGVMNINLTTGESKIYHPEQISDGTVRCITEDDMHRIWLGTEKGVTIIHPDENIEILQQNFVDKNKLNDNAIYTILCDRDGNIWIGTYFGGINILLRKNEQFDWIEPGYNSTNLKGKAVRKIIEPQKNILWIATEDGGLNIFNTETNDITVFDHIPILGHNIHDILYDEQKNSMWIGTFRNGLFLYNLSTRQWQQYLPENAEGLPSDAIFSIKKQRNGTIWIATTQGLRYYDVEKNTFCTVNHNKLDIDFIYCLYIDSDDNVWAGTRNNGLFRIDNKSKEIVGWSTPTLKDYYITYLYQDSNQNIWIGTNNNGLQYIEPTGMQVRSLSLELSLSKNTICSIIEDQSKQLWIGTGQGLYRLNKTRNDIIRYTEEDGLPTNQFNFSSAIHAQNGLYYFGSVNGLISFDPTHMKNERKTFEVHLTQLIIDNQILTANSPDSPLTTEIDNMESITLSYDQSRSFSIEYAAISLGNTSSISYQIRLLGIDDTWHNVGQERKFVGSNLSSGTYTLQIRANNSNMGWEKEAIKEIKLIIQPPFYLSYPAYIIYFILFALAIYFTHHIFSIRLKEKNEVRIANMEKEKLEELNKIKLDFFTSVSHELKTPLSLIMAPLKYISQHYPLATEASEKLDVAIKNTDKMVGLIDELVTFNKVESGNFQFYIQQGNPLEFIESITRTFKESAAEKQIQLFTHCENNGETVWFSPSYVERIMNNLLSNALKFTSAGGKIFVNASIIDNADKCTYLHIEVRDTGIGIAKEELENIFNKYYQTKRGHNKNNKGWGLGLALVKKLAEVHKGNVSVESSIGQGSTFTVNLNVSEKAFDAKDRINADKAEVSLNQYEFTTPMLVNANVTSHVPNEKTELQFSILLVEDNTELLCFLSEIFAPKYNIFTAENGKDALNVVTDNPIDLVISDIMMPVMDGNTLCQKLKNNISSSHIPVILLTAKNDAKDIAEGYESGADAYVQKPFDPQILELQVNNILKNRQILREKMVDNQNSDNIESVSLSKFDKEFINKINDLIEKNMDNDEFSIADITSSLSISRSLLHIKMKSLLNISTGDYIRKRRLNKACSLLKEGYNVSETAYHTGFADPNYFSKAFKKEFGVSPTEYLNNNHKQ